MERISFYDQESRNKRDSILLVLVVFVLLLFIFYVIGELYDPSIVLVFLIFGLVVTVAHVFISYNYGDRIVLASVHARPADDVKDAHLINTVEGIAIAAGVPTPKVYIMDSPEMNAFATGKDPQHASIVVTSGLMSGLNRAELEGVIGHEMSHVRNYDIRFTTLVSVLVGLVAIVSYFFVRSFMFGGMRRDDRRGEGGGLLIILFLIGLVFAIIAPLITRIVQAMISRRREYLADAGSAELTRDPEELASALEKIKDVNTGKMQVSDAVSHMFFVDPTRSPLDRLFDTHPPIDDRIKILREM